MLLKIMNISLLITTSIVGTSAQHHIRKLGYGGCNYLKIEEILENGGHRESDTCATEDGTMYELRLSRQFKRDLNNGLISGETNLHIPRAIIDGRVIRVPPNAAINLRKTRSLQNTKRTLPTTGTKRVFVVKDTSVTMYDTTQVSDNVFGTNGDAVNLKTHFAQCSYNQLLFEPFIGETSSGEYITNGVGEVTIDMNALASSDRYVVHEAVLAAANSKYGNVQQQFDYVMLILPPTTDFKGAAAYAYVNFYLGVYSYRYALMSMIQMHEMGHNLGLAHSGEGSAPYGDQSGCMGTGLYTDDYSGCFNGAKSWQLGWYTDSYYSFNPTLTYFKRGIVGISDYSTRGGSHSHTVIELVGSSTNFYVAFNRKSGMNSQTLEGGDQVLVTKYKGTGYGASDLVAKLGANQEYCFDFTQVAIVCVKVDAISLSADAYADITIALQGQDTTSPNPPTSLCTDSDEYCAYWAGLNYCTEKYVDYMTQSCKKSCNICGSSCTDSDEYCAYWAGLNYCTEKYVGHMTQNCKYSCNIC